MPTISVIVPVYKVEPYIHRCVDSILAQTFSDFELILVDDGSPDNCPQICDEYAEKDNRIHVIHQNNGGLSAARNAGLDAARGECISFIDSDDWISPNMLSVMYEAIQSTNADMAICGVNTVYDENYSTEQYPSDYDMKDGCVNQQEGIQLLSSQAWYYVIACNKLYKKQIFCEIRFPEGYSHEDAAIVHRVFGNCKKIMCISQPLYNYLQRDNSIMHSFSVSRTDILSALADRICYSADMGWTELENTTIRRFVPEYFYMFFKFPYVNDNDKYFCRMKLSLKIAFPHIWKCSFISNTQKLYLLIIRINPKLFTMLHKAKTIICKKQKT